ncbi:hypothetical protein SAMN04487826_1403 [Prevotella sp. khp1]|nr:hypothetical protein SAMN04487826_1403 [Prevotella sp. khp1]
MEFNKTNNLLTNQHLKLHHKTNCKGFIELIDNIRLKVEKRVKVDEYQSNTYIFPDCDCYITAVGVLL